MKFPVFLFIICLISCSYAIAQLGGDGIYNFQNLSYSGRISGLGGELVSWQDNDIQLAHQNPSLLSGVEKGSMGLNYTNYYADVQLSQLNYSIGESKLGYFGFGLSLVSYGEFTAANSNGVKDGYFYAADNSLHVYWAKKIDSLFSIGVDLKNILSEYEQYRSYGVALDLGANYFNPKKQFGAGLVINNLGYQVSSYAETKEKLGTKIHFGLSKKLAHAPFRLHFTFHDLQQLDIRYDDPVNPPATTDPLTGELVEAKSYIGDKVLRHVITAIEFVPSNNFHIRFGYNHQRQREMKMQNKAGSTGFSFGAGIRIKRFYVDYGRSKFHFSGSTNQLTVTTNVNSFFNK